MEADVMLDKNIEEFAVGDDVQSFYLIKSLDVRTSKANKAYLDITLADKTGEINAKYWNVSTDEIEMFSVGNLVKIRGTVTLFKDQLQFKIVKIRLSNENDNVNIIDYVPSAPYSPESMMEEINDFIEDITNDDMKNIVKYIYDNYKVPLMTAPAAKSNHHSVRSGLLYHMLGMLRLAKAISSVYSHLNRDLIYTGVLLHDIEKINEMDADELGVVSSYTMEGQLLGHIIMGIKTVEDAAKQVGADEEISLMIQHMILSHHYEPEFGSPKKPMFPEAEILHYIDMIDARMYDMKHIYKSLGDGEFSEPIFVLDRRRLYKSKIVK